MNGTEAIETLKEHCLNCAYGAKDIDDCDICSCDYRDSVRIAIEALEKQVPKKPRIRKARVAIEYCSLCGERINAGGEYCVYCGQAIDWSEEE